MKKVIDEISEFVENNIKVANALSTDSKKKIYSKTFDDGSYIEVGKFTIIFLETSILVYSDYPWDIQPDRFKDFFGSERKVEFDYTNSEMIEKLKRILI